MVQQKKSGSAVQTFKAAVERLMVAVTFAEAGERKTALELMDETSRPGECRRKGSRRESRNDHQPVLMA